MIAQSIDDVPIDLRAAARHHLRQDNSAWGADLRQTLSARREHHAHRRSALSVFVRVKDTLKDTPL